MNLIPKRFRVRNFRNIDDSDWISLEKVTAFVGRNESGKTSLLTALHKFNPAVDNPYNPQREFPRDRFTTEFDEPDNWPVCTVEFELTNEFRNELEKLLASSDIPTTATITRYYSGKIETEFDCSPSEIVVELHELTQIIDDFAGQARRLDVPENQKYSYNTTLRKLLNWVEMTKENIRDINNLRTPDGIEMLRTIRDEVNGHSEPLTADLVESLLATINEMIGKAETPSRLKQLNSAIQSDLPVFIYFDNYGILDSAVYLPHLLRNIQEMPQDPRVRTINSMFKHVKLTAEEISNLGEEEPVESTSAEIIKETQAAKELRSVKLNSASLDISRKFSNWYGQRRHKIRYQADGQYFRIWVSDDRRPDVDIELESRSKGFQWFFSFYLVFLVESEEGHKDAVLLLDEPGLHLHPTAQQELILFFETLAEGNPLIYTTHSPFLIDGEHIHRVRPVTEDESGHSRVDVESWPEDRETIFPLQAAAGYAMLLGLFQHKNNILVEGMSDYLYLHALNLHCHLLERRGLPDDIHITPCGGTKHVGYIASLFLGHKVRPVVLLDGDDAGRARQNALMKHLYVDHEDAVVMLDDVLGLEYYEIEDMIGSSIIIPALNDMLDCEIKLGNVESSGDSLVDLIESAAVGQGIELPIGWKMSVAHRIVVA